MPGTGTLEDTVFQTRKKNFVRSRVSEMYAGAGFPDVKVKINELEGSTPGDVILEGTVSSGPRVRIKDIAIRGHRKTRTGIVRKQIKVHAGDWYDWKKVMASIDGVNRLGFSPPSRQTSRRRRQMRSGHSYSSSKKRLRRRLPWN